MDVEIILKRLLVYTSAVAAIVAIYVLILRTSGGSFVQSEDEQRWVIAFLATIVVMLLARPVKDGAAAAIDRAFYRDRYDYRRALVAFARDLNGDLELDRLADRLVTRVGETIELDRMALLLATERGDFEPLHVYGLETRLPRLSTALRASAAASASRAYGAAGRSAGGRRVSPPRKWSTGATPESTTSCRASRRAPRSRCSRSAAAKAASR